MRSALAFRLYQALVLLLLPLQAISLLWRARRSPGYRRHWGERFWGAVPIPPPGAGVGVAARLWVHAVSVGETQAAIPLIRQWLAADPSHQLVLTHTTVTGRDTGAQAFARDLGTRVFQAYLPYDLPWAVGRFLTRAAPSLGLLMETEIWPQLLRTSRERGVPVALINGRLSARSARSMHRLAWLARPALEALALAVVQAPEHAQRFREIAPRLSLHVSGSLKFDLPVQPERVEQGRRWRGGLGDRPTVLLASSREDEETAFLEAWKAEAPRHSLLVIVPRHPERFDWVAAEIARAGLSCVRRSSWGSGFGAHPQGAGPGAEVLLGDSLGEMQAYVAMSDCVVVGGSLIPLGGQNPIEACAQGRPVVMGPGMFNFPEIARQLEAAGAAQTAHSAQEAVRICAHWLAHPAAFQEAAEAGLRLAADHRGASQRTLALLAEAGLLGPGRSSS